MLNAPFVSPKPTPRPRCARAHGTLALLLLAGVPASSALVAPAQEPAELRRALGISGVTRSGRTLLRSDPIEAAIVAGSFVVPQEGDTVGESTWKLLEANRDGWFEGPSIARGGYLFVTHEAPEAEVLLLHAEGHSGVYVNGEPRGGDPYASGTVRTPVAFQKGRNTLLFGAGRGRVRARLVVPPAPVFVENLDATLPDVVGDRTTGLLAGVLVTNASTTWRTATIEVGTAGGTGTTRTPIELAPLASRKVPLTLPEIAKTDGALRLIVRVLDTLSAGAGAMSAKAIHETSFDLRRRSETQTSVRTFISGIDGSVQYYAVVPPVAPHTTPIPPNGPPALIMSLHGASVEATSQADAHAPKPWAVTVCPTNRRPFGFDWEDWGRNDAIEVLEHASTEWRIDPTRVYLTGHSMGGHGTWNLGATHPGRFAALAPSAGWCSFWTYSAGPRTEPATEPGRILRDAANGSDTALLTGNLLDHGLFILHGDADDNVPVREAREMRDRLRQAGVEPGYHEQPGAGHWWDGPRAGADCLEWPGITETFVRHRLPPLTETQRIRFSTVDPGQSATRAWATIEQQQQSLAPSSVDLTADAGSRTIAGITANVARLRLLTDTLLLPTEGGEVTITIDGTSIVIPACLPGSEKVLERSPAGWALIAKDAAELIRATKGPQGAGLFKSAFGQRFLMVVGTSGTPEESAWALAKARLDADNWRIRGNGSAEIVTDTRVRAGEVAHAGRNIILYGHADMNALHSVVLAVAPVEIRRGRVSVGDRAIEGSTSSVMMVYPKSAEVGRFVGVIAGTGPAGMRLSERMPIFVSGVGIPDLVIADDALLRGGESGLVCAGFFSNDWTIENGRFAFRSEPAPTNHP
ncbi:MAG: prolyl oligopeptidase family serine peptidase [Phycisphaerales bacterium]